MIPVAKPDLSQKEFEQVRDSFNSGWIGLGPKVNSFEEQFKEKFNYNNAIATNSCTSALDLALKTISEVNFSVPEGPTTNREVTGTEVLIPSITWISTAFAGIYNNYDVRFVDVDETLCMSVEDLRKRISDETAAVIPVHYGGQPAKVDEIVDIAHSNGAVVVEDCAHAPGAKYANKYVGSYGDIGCFSFQATKPLTTGEGGMLVTDHESISDTVRRWAKLGVNKSTHERSEEEGYDWYYEVTDVGYKYFMHDISAGIGLAQLQRFDKLQSRRQCIADDYTSAFDRCDWLDTLPRRPETHHHSRYNYTLHVPPEDREEIIGWLGEHDIGSTVHYMPLYKHPIFEGTSPNLTKTENVWESILTLPMSSTMTDDDVDKVINCLLSFK